MFEMNGKNDNQSQPDQQIAEMVGYGILLVLLVIGIIFFSPVLIFTLIFTIVMKFMLSKKVSNILSLLSILGLGASFYFWSYLPLLQFASWWKKIDKLSNILVKAEDLLQQGTLFHVTYKSYIMALLAGVVLARLLFAVLNRLGVTFFTKEKEEVQEKYKNSSKYENMYKKKGKYLNTIQEKYRKSTAGKVLLGMDIYKRPVTFLTKNLFTHCLVQGTTGTGKTYMLYNIMEEAFRENMGCIFVDGKGDPKTEKEIKRLANFYGKTVYVFSDRSKWHYNPVKYGKATAIKDRLMAVMDWSEQYYKNASENALQQVILFIQDYIKLRESFSEVPERFEELRNDLNTYIKYLDFQEIANFLFLEQSYFVVGGKKSELNGVIGEKEEEQEYTEETARMKLCKKYIKLFFNQDQLTVEDVENIVEENKAKDKILSGLKTQLELLMYSDLGEKFIEKEGETLDIKEIISQGDIVLFSLDSNNYDSFIGTIGRFVISDCAYITTELYGNTENFNGVLGVFDEFGSYGNDKIVSILSKARSAKMGAILGIQSISDLQNKSKDIDIKEQTIDNCNMFILGRTNSTKNTEEIAGLIGTYRDIDRTVMTENQGGKLLRFETKGERGTVRKVNKFKFSPDEIKELPNYQFYYVNKNIEEDNSKKVFARNVFEGL